MQGRGAWSLACRECEARGRWVLTTGSIYLRIFEVVCSEAWGPMFRHARDMEPQLSGRKSQARGCIEEESEALTDGAMVREKEVCKKAPLEAWLGALTDTPLKEARR